MNINKKLKFLSEEIQTSIDRIIKKFSEVGINKSESDSVTQKEKEILLAHLKKENYNKLDRTIQKKIRRNLNISKIIGKSKYVSMEWKKNKDHSNQRKEKESNNIEDIINKNNIEKIKIDAKKNREEELYRKVEKKIFYEPLKIKKNDRKNTEYHVKISNKKEKNLKMSRGKWKNNRNILEKNVNYTQEKVKREVVICKYITMSEISKKMEKKVSYVMKSMMNIGKIATINERIDQKTAQLLAEEMGYKIILHREKDIEKSILSERMEEKNYEKEPRNPVVTIMGHVDHGKTTLLDYIRSTKIAKKEAGGITQHIGAYNVETENGMITFLDTPGHEAFTSMRARGVKATDIVVLVVAADDGVMPQTIESIQHAQSENVPLVVAINKIDKLESDPVRVKNELSQYGVIPEEWGGENQFIKISAKSGIGIEYLLKAILLQSEIMELKAVRRGMASGVVIESSLKKGMGPVATILVQEGTINKGDIILCGLEYGKIRAMRDAIGREVSSAGPSIPVEILGLSNVPEAGTEATVVRDEKKAREVAIYRKSKLRELKFSIQNQSKRENRFYNIHEIYELNIILKSDVQGSCEAICDSLLKLSTNEVQVKIIFYGVGSITETDVTLAAASNALLLGFNVRAEASVRKVIESEKIDIRYYDIIYNLIEEVKLVIIGMIEPKYKKNIIGIAEVRHVFPSKYSGCIAGCMVIEGTINRTNLIRIIRDHRFIYEGEIESLRRFKEDVNEVRNGLEFGISLKKYKEIKKNDKMEGVEIMKIKNTLHS